ncbi:hypothetical protein ACLOJK_023622, partial [Asimina triloba]
MKKRGTIGIIARHTLINDRNIINPSSSCLFSHLFKSRCLLSSLEKSISEKNLEKSISEENRFIGRRRRDIGHGVWFVTTDDDQRMWRNRSNGARALYRDDIVVLGWSNS